MLDVFTAREICYANSRALTLPHDSQRGRVCRKGTHENEEATVPTSEDLPVQGGRQPGIQTSPKCVKKMILKVESI